MKQKIALYLCLLLFVFSCSKKEETAKPDEPGDLQPPFAGRVTASSLFIRSQPATGGPIVAKVLRNRRIDVVSILEKSETIGGKKANWYKVKYEGGVAGYCFGAFIAKAKPDDTLGLPPSPSVLNCPEQVDSSYELGSCVEKRMLPGMKGRVERKGRELRIICGNGKVLTFIDIPNDNDKNVDDIVYYLFQHYYADVNHYLVLLHYWESLEYRLINGMNGVSVDIWEEPHYSPDRRRLLCASMDLVAQYDPNGIQIFAFDESSFTKEQELKLTWGPAAPAWTDNNRIVLTRYDQYNGEDLPFEAVMEFKNNKWVVY